MNVVASNCSYNFKLRYLVRTFVAEMVLVQTLDLELVPDRRVFVALFDGVTPDYATRVLEHYLPTVSTAGPKEAVLAEGPEQAGSKRKAEGSVADEANTAAVAEPTPATTPTALPLALIDANLVFSKYHFAVAANNAVRRAAVGIVPGRGKGLRTRSVHSELLLCLAAGRSIDGALKSLGLNANSTRVVLASFESAAVVEAAAALFTSDGNEEGSAKSPPPTAVSWETFETSAWERRATFAK